MATPTYTLIDSVTLGASAASVTFSSISATGKGDLVLVVDGSASADSLAFIEFNSDTTMVNYFFVYALGTGSSTSSSAVQDPGYLPIQKNISGNALMITQVLDFSASDKHKSVLNRGNSTQFGTTAAAHRWASTSAITSVYIYEVNATSFSAGSTFHLYQLVSE
jgi:hypothetical protein